MQLSSLLPANYVNARFSDTESIVTLLMLWLQTSIAEVEAQFSLWQTQWTTSRDLRLKECI